MNCQKCKKELSKKGLSLHLYYNKDCKDFYKNRKIEKDNSTYLYKCPNCKEKLKSKLGIPSHIKNRPKCQEKIRKESERERKNRKYNSECPYCHSLIMRKGFSSHIKYNEKCRKKWIEKGKPKLEYICFICKKEFKNSKNLNSHFKNFHKKDFPENEGQPKIWNKKYIEENKIEIPINCSLCNKTLDIRYIGYHYTKMHNNNYENHFSDILSSLNIKERDIVDDYIISEYSINDINKKYFKTYNYDHRNIIKWIFEKNSIKIRKNLTNKVKEKIYSSYNFKNKIRSRPEKYFFNVLQQNLNYGIHHSVRIENKFPNLSRKKYFIIDIIDYNKNISIEYDGIHHFKKIYSNLNFKDYMEREQKEILARNLTLLEKNIIVFRISDFGNCYKEFEKFSKIDEIYIDKFINFYKNFKNLDKKIYYFNSNSDIYHSYLNPEEIEMEKIKGVDYVGI